MVEGSSTVRERYRTGMIEEGPPMHATVTVAGTSADPGQQTPPAAVRSAAMDLSLRFVELVNGPTPNVDLTEGWAVLSAHAHPDLDVQALRDEVRALGDRCPEPTLDGVRRLLFDDLGFCGNHDDYYAPSNSLLDQVLRRRLGLPIALSALMMEVGRAAAVPLDGVAMPGHFLVRDRVLGDVFVDPFSGGATMDSRGCEAVFRKVAGPKAPFDPRYLDPVPAATILSRMAANLVQAYRRCDDRGGLRWAARLRSRCPGVSPQELVQLAQALHRCGAFDEAAAVLDEAAPLLQDDERDRWRLEAGRYRARLN